MQDFDLRKYMSNNKLHQSDIGGFSITELQLTSKSDFEIGLAILSEMGYDVSKESLNEIKFPSWITNFGKKIKSKVLDKFDKIKSNKDPLKKAKEEMQSSLDQLKLEYPEEWEEIKNMDLTDPKNISKIVPQENLQEAEKDDNISSKTLKKSKNKRRLGGLAMLLGYIGILASGMNISADEVKKYAEQTDAKAKTELTQDVKTEPVIDPNTDYELGGDDVFKTQHKKGESDIDDKKGEAKELIKALGIDKMSKGTKAKIGVKGKISSTLGDQDDNPNGPKKDGLGKDRLDQGKEVLDIAKEIAADEYDVDIDIEDQGTNVKDALADKSNEVDADSKEASSGQTTDYTLLDVDTGDTDVAPDDTSDTDDTETNIIPPQDIIGFYSDKPDFDSNKYMVIAFQFLPRIIGNGKIVNNPAFERFAKHLTIDKSGETFNDAFVSRRIDGTEGSLVKKAAKAKGREKEEILDTIDTLRWIRNTKKSPSSLSKGIKALDPNIKLGERGKYKFRFEKGKTPKAGQAAIQKGSDNKGKSGLMERLEKLIPTTLQLTEITNAPGFNQDSAKENLGLLTHLFSGIWSGKDDSFIEFDNAYLEDKYKSSVDDFYTKFPSIGEKIKLKVKEKEKVSTTTPTTKSTSSNVKVGDTVELDPKVKKTKKTKDIPIDPELAKDFDLKDTPTEKDVSLSGDKMDIKTGLDRSYKFIDTKEELQKLLVALLTVNINDTLRKNPAKLKSILFQVRNRFNPKGQPELKENLDFIIEAVEGMPKDTAKAIKFLNQYSDVQTLLKKINTPEELIQFILRELLPELKPAFLKKSADIKGAIVGASNVIGKLQPKDLESSKTVSKSQAKDISKQLTAEQIKSLIKNILTEGLTPGQASKVKDKYKQIYSGMLKGDKKKLLKYIDPKFNRPNPDAMATGRAINLVKKEEDENVEESKTEKQRKWACAQVDSKSRPKGLSKAQAKEMCSDTNLSKNESMKNTRLQELIKTALKGPVEEESFPDLTGDGKVTKADILKGRGVKLEEGTELVDKHGYEFKRFSMGEEGPGLQITDKSSSNPAGTFIHIPGSKLGFFASALTDAIRVFDDMSRQLPVEEEELDAKQTIRGYGLDRGAPDPKDPHFKNIFKDDGITIPKLKERILKELRGNVNEQDYKFQDAKDLTVKPLRPLLEPVAKKVADEIEKMAKSGKFQKIQDNEGAVGNADLSLALGVEVLAALEDKI
tara:strand:+ start:2635 stop:6276 length:3642 start_codon:yes stop_codon:yes gene_type:complete